MSRRVEHEVRRKEIIHALWLVVYRRGIEGASLRAVAAEAGVSVGRIQHYFASKEELLREGCRAMVDSAAEAHLPEGQDPADRIRALAAHAIPTCENSRIAVSVWHAYLAHVDSDPVVAQVVRRAVAGGRDHLACCLGQVRGLGAPGLVEVAAAARLQAVGTGLAVQVLVGALSVEEGLRLAAAEAERVLQY